MAAVVIQREQQWTALLLLAPVYLAYQTYGVFAARLEDQRRHLDELTRLEGERRELLERERAARENAEAANRLKDQFWPRSARTADTDECDPRLVGHAAARHAAGGSSRARMRSDLQQRHPAGAVD